MLLQLPISRIWLYEWSSELHEERKPDPNSKMYENHERSMLQEASSHPYVLKSWSFLPAVPVDAAERSSLWERPKKREITCRFWGSEKPCYLFLPPFLIKALWACLPGTWPRQSHHINGCLGEKPLKCLQFGGCLRCFLLWEDETSVSIVSLSGGPWWMAYVGYMLSELYDHRVSQGHLVFMSAILVKSDGVFFLELRATKVL